MSTQAVYLSLAGIALVLVLVFQWNDTRYSLQHGYVSRGWRKKDRLLREDDPVMFWFLTKGRLLGVIAAFPIWAAFVWMEFQ